MIAPTLNEDEFDRRPGVLEVVGGHEYSSISAQQIGDIAIRQAMRRITLLEYVGAFGTNLAERN